MLVLYNEVEKRVVATGLVNGAESVAQMLGNHGSWLTIRDVDADLTDAPYKLKVTNNYDRDTVSDWLFAEHSNLNPAEIDEFNRCVNTSTSPDYFVQVDKDAELYDAYEDL